MSSPSKTFSIKLSDLLKGYLSQDKLEKLKDITVNGLTLDSRKIKSGYLFFAVNGEEVNGVEFINNALDQNVVAVIWEASEDVDAIELNWRKTTSNIEVPIIAIANLTQIVGELADRF